MRAPPALLDVNVLIALYAHHHVHHHAAHAWFAANRTAGWATCPITENGLVRILSTVKYPSFDEGVPQIRTRLATLCATDDHLFWADEISLRDDTHFDPTFAVSRHQITDIYLLALAKHKGGRLATFDRGIPVKGVIGATPDHLAVIPA